MATTSDFKRGMRILLDDDPWVIVDYKNQSPSARGGATLVKGRIRNLRTGKLLDKTWKSGERIQLPDFEIRNCQYLYDENGETFYFMDQETYDQFGLEKSEIERELGFILPNDTVRAMIFDGRCIGIEVSNTVELKVKHCDPGVRGDTVNNVTKPATLETGLVVQVPLFVEEGQLLLIDTRESRYIRRI